MPGPTGQAWALAQCSRLLTARTGGGRYSNFTSTSGLNLWGNTGCGVVANDTNTGGANWLLLTPDQADNGAGQKGGVWTTAISQTINGFVTDFGFKIVNSVGTLGNGFGFSIQDDNDSYWCGDGGPLTNSVTVQFCTSNPVNSVVVSGYDSSGAAISVAQQNLTPLGLTLGNGNLHDARVEYDNNLMNVYIDGVAVITQPSHQPGYL